jgi:hypothetical protein
MGNRSAILRRHLGGGDGELRTVGVVILRVRAAAERDEVVRELGRMTGRHGAARVPHVTPGASFQARPLALVLRRWGRVAGDPLVEVAGHVVHAVAAHAAGHRAAGDALIEPLELRPGDALVVRVGQRQLGIDPGVVHVAGVVIPRVSVRKRRVLRAFARGHPLALVTEPFSPGSAGRLRVVPGHHPGRVGALLVRVLVLVDAEGALLFLPHAARLLGELVTEGDVIGLVLLLLETGALDTGAEGPVHEEHVLRTGRGLARGGLRRIHGGRGARRRRRRGGHEGVAAGGGRRGQSQRPRGSRRSHRLRRSTAGRDHHEGENEQPGGREP